MIRWSLQHARNTAVPCPTERRQHRQVVRRHVATTETRVRPVDYDPEVKAKHKRPSGWVPPGPPPAGPQGRADLQPGPDEDLSFLTGDWRIFQLKTGHRWSLDDMMTAYVALQEAQQLGSVSHHLDQGCGIGSVLMMLAWGLPQASCTGIEAQDCSVALARRSLAYNGAAGRCRVIHGDLRAPLPADLPSTFPLITGTPPYIPLGRGNVSERIQKGPCCFETRGGIEDYCAAAAGRLQEQGLFVVCAGVQGQPANRSWDAAKAAGLKIVRQVEVVPRDGKPALMHVFAMQLQDTGSRPEVQQEAFETFLVREADGRLSQHMHEARRFMGLPPSKQ